MLNLMNADISLKNKNIKFLENEHHIIVAKNDKKQGVFDTIVFASQNIQRMTVPKQIRFI